MLAIMLLSIGADISGGDGVPRPTITYAEFRSRVERLPPGQYLTLTVGQLGENRCDDSKAVGIANGVYSCWYDGTQAKMQRIEPPATINANAANSPYALGSPCANGRCPTPSRR